MKTKSFIQKSFFTLFLLSIYYCGYSQYTTTYTGTVDAGKWTKIATITATSQVANSSVLLQFTGGYNGTPLGATGKIFIRVKQQNAFPNTPFIQLELLESNSISMIMETDFIAVTTLLTGTGTTGTSTIEFYFKNRTAYESYKFVVLEDYKSSGITSTFYSSQANLATLPTGTQTNCTNKTAYFESNVSIGTKAVTPSYILSVKGGIATDKITAKTSTQWAWPDYVFDDNYELMNLDSLHQYTIENKHLPNVPSAQEVQENGIDLAQMNAQLLRKVEELTLYMLQINAQTEELKNQVKALQNQNTQLQQVIKK